LPMMGPSSRPSSAAGTVGSSAFDIARPLACCNVPGLYCKMQPRGFPGSLLRTTHHRVSGNTTLAWRNNCRERCRCSRVEPSKCSVAVPYMGRALRGSLTLRMGDRIGLSADHAGLRLPAPSTLEACDGDVGRSTLFRTSFDCDRWQPRVREHGHFPCSQWPRCRSQRDEKPTIIVCETHVQHQPACAVSPLTLTSALGVTDRSSALPVGGVSRLSQCESAAPARRRGSEP